MELLNAIKRLFNLTAKKIPYKDYKDVKDENVMLKHTIIKIATSHNSLLDDYEKILAKVDVLDQKFTINEKKFNILYAQARPTRQDKTRISELEKQLDKLIFAPDRIKSNHKRIDIKKFINEGHT